MTNPVVIRRSVGHDASWIFGGRMATVLLQAAYFVLLARLLGVSDYGVFAGAFALVSTLTPYSALGAAMLFMRYLALDPLLSPKYWGNALITTAAFTLASLLAVGITRWWHGKLAYMGIIVVLLVANCLFLQITTLGSMLVFALGNARASAWMNLISNLCRVLVVVAMKIGMGRANAFQWSFGVLIASAIAAVAVLYQIYRTIGPAQYDLRLLRRRIGEGLGYAFAGTTEAVNNDVDKVMLSYDGLEIQNGFYTLAYRILDFATSPIVALNTAVVQRHFVLSQSGIRPRLRLAFRSIAVSSVLGVGIALAIPALAPLLPRLTGRDFSGAIQVLRFLCWLPLIRGLHQMCGSVITGAGHQNWRTAAQFSVALLNLGLNWSWIPRLGWVGAARATLASDGSLAVLNAVLLLVLTRMLLHREANSPLPVSVCEDA
ncbi:MAG: oligosaccharide flippase family protein [Candidatus Sulfotelmatobacter sp.]